MTLSVLAPMSGATVGVATVQIAGRVSPAGSAVQVGGQPATVHGTSFDRSVTLGPGTTSIPVTASAQGWSRSSVTVTVHYSPGLALALTAARATALAGPPKALAQAAALPANGGGVATTVGGGASSVGFIPTVKLSASSGAGGSGSGSKPAGTAATTTPTPASPTPTSPGSTPPVGAAPGGGAPTTTTPPPTTAPATPPQPGLNTPLNRSQVRSAYLTGCVQSAGTRKAQAYCACTYRRVARAGALRTRARILGLMRKVKRFERIGKISALPKWFVTAVLACVSKLPPPSLRLHQLPGVHHPAAAPAGSGTPAAPAVPAAPGQVTTLGGPSTTPTAPTPAAG